MNMNSNSVSFNTGYPKVCMDAYENDEVFNIFKNKPMSREEKKELLNLLKK